MVSLPECLVVNLIGRIRSYFFGIREPRLPEESTRSERGRFGENLAAEHCQCKLGYRIIARNWSYQREVDTSVGAPLTVLLFVLLWAKVAIRGMSPNVVVKQLDVLKHFSIRVS